MFWLENESKPVDINILVNLFWSWMFFSLETPRDRYRWHTVVVVVSVLPLTSVIINWSSKICLEEKAI